MTTSTYDHEGRMVTVPDPKHVFKMNDILYVWAQDESRRSVKVGTEVEVAVHGAVDADDEIHILHDTDHYIGRKFVSLHPPVRLDTPPSLNPEDVASWLEE